MSVFITRGMRLSIPAGGLKISANPTDEALAPVAVQVGLTLFPLWIEIALGHLRKAHMANAALMKASSDKASDTIASALEEEFTHGMQSIAASATAIDAFYASIKSFAEFSKEEVAGMQAAKTRRPARIKETFRRVFGLRSSSVGQLDLVLTNIYRLRDLTVHPAAGQTDPLLHPILKVGVEWRFIAFSCSNAHEILRGSLSLLMQLLEKGTSGEELLKKECFGYLPLLKPVVADWESAFGPLRS